MEDVKGSGMQILNVRLIEDASQAVMTLDAGVLVVSGITDSILRCVYTKEKEIKKGSAIGICAKPQASLTLKELPEREMLVLETKEISLEISTRTGRFTWYRKLRSDDAHDRDLSGKRTIDMEVCAHPEAENPGETEDAGRTLLLQEGDKELTPFDVEVWTTGGEAPQIRRVHTVDGDRNFVDNLRPVADHRAYRAKLSFCWQEGEHIHGLGQGEEGIFDYRGHVQYLYQHNMRIPMPWLLSSRGYAILADCGCLMTFNDDERGSYLYMDTVDQLDYYFLAGQSADELIRGQRFLTGKASLLPKWAFGYVQSKERYESQEELIKTAGEYRTRGVGLDCIVQDWKTWSGDRWGEKRLDPERFPDRRAMREALHGMHVHSMVSVWPNMNYDTADCAQMQKAGHLLHDLATYDAFDEEARALYWKQAKEGLYQDGFDSWWCDSTEPFSGPDWGGETKREPWERYELVGGEHKKYLGAERANLFALYHAKGMFENQKKDDPDHRMLNLTRSGYASIQKYGAVLWSGDTAASWKTLRTQLTECLNMAASGYPWWTFDAGAFFTVKDNWQGRGCGCNEDPTPKWFWQGDFEEGVKDPGYRELYVRWLQMAAFLPMMRSHGTDTPREIWQFGEEGTPWYDAIKKAIALRYRLMPYLYSLAGGVWKEDGMMVRPLCFDFPGDEKAARSDAAFLLGKSLLVYPVTEPMEYGPGGVPLTKEHVWNCHLPEGADWFLLENEVRSIPDGEKAAEPGVTDFVDGCRSALKGGTDVRVKADLDIIPVFVRAGSILPMEQRLTYAQEVPDTPLELHIFPGKDATFFFYEDEGDGYGYEAGKYNVICMHWDDAGKTLTIGPSGIHFQGGMAGRACTAILGDQKIDFRYDGETVRVQF